MRAHVLLLLCLTVRVGLAQPATPRQLEVERKQVVSALEAAPEGADALREQLVRQRQILDELLILAQRPAPLAEGATLLARKKVADALAKLDEQPPPTAPPDPTQAGIEQLEAEVEGHRAAVETLQADTRQQELRIGALPGQIAAEAAALGEARARAATTPEDDPGDEVAAAAKRTAQLEVRLAQAQLEALQAELEGLQVQSPLQADQLRLARRQLSRGERALKAYRDALASQITVRREAQEAALAAAEAELAGATDPTDQFIARWRLESARARLAESKLDADRLGLMKLITRQRDRLVVERDEVAGLRLQIQRGGEDAPSPTRLKELYRRADQRHRELRDERADPALTATNERRSHRYEVADRAYTFDPTWDDAVAKLEPLAPPTRRTIAKLRDEALAAVRAELRALEEVIGATSVARSLLAERQTLLDELDRLVRSRIFWVQDAPALWAIGLDAPQAEIARLGGVASQMLDEGMSPQPALWFCVLVLLAAGLGRHRLLVSAEARQASGVADLQRALATSLVPGAAFCVVLLLEQASLPELVAILARKATLGLAWLALAWWALEVLFSPSGLGLRHLAVPEATAVRVIRAGRTLLVAALATWLPASVLSARPLALVIIPRFGQTIFAVTALLVVARLFRPGRSVLRPVLHAIGGDHAMRFGRLIGSAVILVGLALVGMDLSGFRYGASWIGTNAMHTVALLLPVWLVFPGTVKLAARRFDPDERSAHRWVIALFAVFTVISLAMIWEIDRRAITGLDGVEVLRLTGEGPRAAITLLDLAKFIATMAVTITLLRIIPGVLRVLVYPYLRTDAGGRYAILTISRYGIFLIGTIAALSAIHLDLGRLSWLMAAVGVGLGFGLQEIVANFVSGLILLLERPIKVGDFVTIGTVEGEITQINIRATTVMNLDRQELIVPNRDFITKEVTNWTRADTVVRLAIPIGVAYGTEIALVDQTLLAVAKANEEVLPMPAPSVQMLGHGDSSLDFRLLVFHADPRRAAALRGHLNRAVNQALADAGIEIPFPQRDLHLRSSDVQLFAKAPETE